MTKCLLLDVDGVVVTGRPKDGAFWATDLERDLGIDPDMLRTGFFEPHWGDIVVGRGDLRAVLEACLGRLGMDVSAHQLMAYWFENDARLDQQLLGQVAELRGRGLAVLLATNQEHYRARFLMDVLGLASHVDGIIYSADLGVKKPDPVFYEACLARAECPAAEIAFVDDTKANVEAAQRAGFLALHWDGSGDLRDLVI